MVQALQEHICNSNESVSFQIKERVCSVQFLLMTDEALTNESAAIPDFKIWYFSIIIIVEAWQKNGWLAVLCIIKVNTKSEGITMSAPSCSL